MENLKQEETAPPQSPPTLQPTPSPAPKPSPKKKYLLIGVIVAIAIGIGAFVLLTQKEIPSPNPEPTNTSSLPVISLRYEGKIYEGVQGSYCWPTGGVGEGVALCADTTFPESDETIVVRNGKELEVLIETTTAPDSLEVSIFNEEQSFITSLELTADLTSSINIDQTSGIYYLLISGAWSVGDIGYGFKIEVQHSLDISNWQTYRNEELGFEMKYPRKDEFADMYIREDFLSSEKWNIVQLVTRQGSRTPEGEYTFTFMISKNPIAIDYTLEKAIQDVPSIIEKRYIIISGVPAIRIITRVDQQYREMFAVALKEKTEYQFHNFDSIDGGALGSNFVLNQILSTIQFID